MDLATLDTKKGADLGFDLHLRHPATGDPIGAVIRIAGMDSERYRDKATAQQRARFERLARRNRFDTANPEEQREEAIQLLAAATLGWDDVNLNGQAVPFSESAAADLYRNFAWVREQVDVAMHERANFLPPSATGLPSSPVISSS
jgi:hypothetical protein